MSRINNIVNTLKKNVKQISIIVMFIAVIFLAIFSFIRYKTEKDIAIGQQINELESILIQIERSASEEISLANEEKLEEVKAKLTSIYEGNKQLKNGLRAQFILAKLNYKNQQKKIARDKFLSIFEADKKHYLAAISLIYAALTYEEEALYKEAQALLERHKAFYEGHYTQGEALIALARLQQVQGQYHQSLETLELIQNKIDLKVYHEKAQEQMDLLTLKGLLEHSPITPEAKSKQMINNDQ